MKLKPRLFGGAKIDNLQKQSLELSQAMRKQPTPAELTQLEKVLEEIRARLTLLTLHGDYRAQPHPHRTVTPDTTPRCGHGSGAMNA